MWDSHPLKPNGGPLLRLTGGTLESLIAIYQCPLPPDALGPAVLHQG